MKFTKQGIIISVVTTLFLFLSSGGFAMEQSIDEHPHFFPYTKVLAEEYHLRLAVDHSDSKMMLIFEDISEKAVRVVSLKTIRGEVLLPGGDTRMVEFKAVKGKSKRTRRDPLISSLSKRKAGRFEVTADWIKTTPDFDLIASFPFKGKDYKFVFNYTTGGHMFPFHMMR